MDNKQNEIFWKNVKIEMAHEGISYDRMARGLSNHQHKDGFKVSKSSIANYVNNKSYPNDDRIYDKVVAFLGVPMEELLEKDHMKKKYNIEDEHISIVDILEKDTSWMSTFMMLGIFLVVSIAIAELRHASAIPVVGGFFIVFVILYLSEDLVKKANVPIGILNVKVISFMTKHKITILCTFVLAVVLLPVSFIDSSLETLLICVLVELLGIFKLISIYKKSAENKKEKRTAIFAMASVRFMELALLVSIVTQIYAVITPLS